MWYHEYLWARHQAHTKKVLLATALVELLYCDLFIVVVAHFVCCSENCTYTRGNWLSFVRTILSSVLLHTKNGGKILAELSGALERVVVSLWSLIFPQVGSIQSSVLLSSPTVN